MGAQALKHQKRRFPVRAVSVVKDLKDSSLDSYQYVSVLIQEADLRRGSSVIIPPHSRLYRDLQ